MKRFLPLVALALGILYLASSLRPADNPSEFDIEEFGRLPVLLNGRIKPMDTVARTTLLMIQSRQRVVTEDGQTLAPVEWLLDTFYNAPRADTHPVFRIDSLELLELMELGEDKRRIRYDSTLARGMAVMGFLPSYRSRFSFTELQPRLAELQRQAELAQPIEAPVRTPFQKSVVNLMHHVMQYHQLKHSLVMPDSDNFFGELTRFQNAVVPGIAAVRARQAGQPHDEAAAVAVLEAARRFDFMDNVGSLLAIPPDAANADDAAWEKTGSALLASFETGFVNPNAMAYAGLGFAWRRGQHEEFNTIIGLYRDQIAKRFDRQLTKSDAEVRFNQIAPFGRTTISIYVLAGLMGAFSWLKWPDVLGKSAYYLMTLAWIVTTAGIAMRMWLEGRPPVTNLYSSALFVAWGAVGLCLVLEKIYKNAIGSVTAGMIGFCALVIAHHLSFSGDTLEMMRAVLDSNFWLATHVIVITIGYSATFLAGFLGIVYILRGLFTQSLDRGSADALNRMVYGIVCFATLFSLVGTILGGIWADQSWGRFWGWDPKENGALLIVIWNAIILHARWGGLVRTRGLMSLAVGGNIITAWSWFGTNMLGVGLHSYGFMDAAFWWLSAFIVSQLAIMSLAAIPQELWRSFRPAA